jgi:hypothetical protein
MSGTNLNINKTMLAFDTILFNELTLFIFFRYNQEFHFVPLSLFLKIN